jgi:hypothetical protein
MTTGRYVPTKGLIGRVRKLLREAPSTVGEVAALLQTTRRTAQVGLWYLGKWGDATWSGKVLDDRGYRVRLWTLTEQGRNR